MSCHPGTLARDEDFAVKTVPVSELPPAAIADTPEARASLRGSLIRSYLEPGMPIRAEGVLRPRDRGFIASVLRDGYRAVDAHAQPYPFDEYLANRAHQAPQSQPQNPANEAR